MFNPITYLLVHALDWQMTYGIFSIALFIVGTLVGTVFYCAERDEPLQKPDGETIHEFPEDTSDILNKEVHIPRFTLVLLGGLWVFASILIGVGYYAPLISMVCSC